MRFCEHSDGGSLTLLFFDDTGLEVSIFFLSIEVYLTRYQGISITPLSLVVRETMMDSIMTQCKLYHTLISKRLV